MKITSSQIQIWQVWNQLDHQRVRNKRVGEDYHKWLQQYGFAVHCFLVDTNTYGIDLSQLFKAASRSNRDYERSSALNLLTPNNCTAHWVLPVLHHMKSLLADTRIGMVHAISNNTIVLSLKLVKAGSFPIQRDHSPQWSPHYQFTDESPHCNGKSTLSVSKKRRKTYRRLGWLHFKTLP